jgi:hypothetical protein
MATLAPEFKIAYAELVEANAYVSARTRSLRYVQRKTTGQAFDFRIRSTKIEDVNLKKVMASISAIGRDNSDLEILIPIYSNSNATTIIASTPATKGAYTIGLANVTGVAIGDFFTAASGKKAYQVTSIVNNVIEFAPNLVANILATEVITFNGMVFNFKIAGRPQSYPLSSTDQSVEIELDLVEKW